MTKLGDILRANLSGGRSKKIFNMDMNELSEEVWGKEERGFFDHARLGKRYCQFPLGTLIFLGKTLTDQ
jgi:hypothetical protein